MLNDELESYLEDLSQHATAATVASHRSTLTQFVDKCQNQGITADRLSPQLAAEYLADASANHRPTTVRGKISTLTNFLTYVGRQPPEIIRWKIQRELKQQTDDSISSRGSDSEEYEENENLKVNVNAYLDYVRSKAYGTRVHAATEIVLATGCRLKSIRELDVEDLQLDAGTLEVSIPEKYAVSHNNSVTTRTVTLPEECIRAVKIYLEHERIPFENGDNTEPLFTTQHGRLSAATLRRSIQAMIDSACSDSTGDEADFAPAQPGNEDDRQLSPTDIRRYYIIQLTEE